MTAFDFNAGYADVVALTPEWHGERSADGRPRVSDDIVERLEASLTIERAWSYLKELGFKRQYSSGFGATNPGTLVVGRALCATFMPYRPDLDRLVEQAGTDAGLETGIGGQNVWIIDRAEVGDVLVVDMFGKQADGPFIGDLLATTLWARTRKGLVVDGTIRDVDGVTRAGQLKVLHRGVHPSFIKNVTLAALNGPTRIGDATALPGDLVVLGDHGALFIPPQHAEQVLERAEDVASRDRFAKAHLADGAYTSAELDVPVWAEPIESHYQQWRARDSS